MISYIVASHNESIFAENLLATLELSERDEVVAVWDAPSIAVAYNEGSARARNRIRCYIHHDVQLKDSRRLRQMLIDWCRPDIGMVGVIGSRTRAVPWWGSAHRCGSVFDGRGNAPMGFSPGGELCAYLDGLLLATAQDTEWDESYEGFHLYDHDMCEQMLHRDLPNFCLAGGHQLVFHNTNGSANVDQLYGWGANVDKFRAKWHSG